MPLLSWISLSREEIARGALVLAVPLMGISSAIIIIPSLPDLQRGLHASDDQGRASLCALWNGAYSFGSALGPFVATLVYSSYGWPAVVECMAAVSVFAILILSVPSISWPSFGKLR